MIESGNKINKLINFNVVPYKDEYLIFVLCLLNDDKPMLLYAKTTSPNLEMSQIEADHYFYGYTPRHTEIKLTCPLFGQTLFKLISLDDIGNKKEVSKKELEKLIGCDII